jgi:hypothetical protein
MLNHELLDGGSLRALWYPVLDKHGYEVLHKRFLSFNLESRNAANSQLSNSPIGKILYRLQ